MLEKGLKEHHWGDLANLRLNLGYYRHRFIQTINAQLSARKIIAIEELEQMAQVDELLKAAGESFEKAKSILFDMCYEGTTEER